MTWQSFAPGALPTTNPHVATACGFCVKCHPGRQFGGDGFCRKPSCGCHRRDA